MDNLSFNYEVLGLVTDKKTKIVESVNWRFYAKNEDVVVSERFGNLVLLKPKEGETLVEFENIDYLNLVQWVISASGGEELFLKREEAMKKDMLQEISMRAETQEKQINLPPWVKN